MQETPEVRAATPRRLRRLEPPRAEFKTEEKSPSHVARARVALRIVGAGLWFGLAAGLAEVGFLMYVIAQNPIQYLGQHQMSRHYSWMLPLGLAVVFGGAAAIVSVLVWVKGVQQAWKIALGMMVALTVYSLGSLYSGLYELAVIVLAVGIGVQLGPWLSRHLQLLKWVAGLSTPVMVGVIAFQGVTIFNREVLAEQKAVAALPPAKANAPNVLLVVLDTVSAEHLSLYGYHKPTTPRIEALASQGVTFDMARSTANWTLPAHCSIMTGYLPNELHVGTALHPLDSKYPTLAEFFAKQGYYTTGIVGNTYFCSTWHGLSRGFQHYEDFYEQNLDISVGSALRCSCLGRRLTALVCGTAYNAREGVVSPPKDAIKINKDFAHWLKGHDDRPFFAFLNYNDAHDPYQTPPGFNRHLGKVPQTPEEEEGLRNYGGFLGEQHLDVSIQPKPIDLELARDAYDDCILALDTSLGQLFDSLLHRGILDNTIVIVTADHGEGFGLHNQYAHGASLYRSEVHVPLIIYDPSRSEKGLRVTAPVSTREIAATLADMVGKADKSPFPGRSLVGFWDPSRPEPEAADDSVVSLVQIQLDPAKEPNPKRAPPWWAYSRRWSSKTGFTSVMNSATRNSITSGPIRKRLTTWPIGRNSRRSWIGAARPGKRSGPDPRSGRFTRFRSRNRKEPARRKLLPRPVGPDGSCIEKLELALVSHV